MSAKTGRSRWLRCLGLLPAALLLLGLMGAKGTGCDTGTGTGATLTAASAPGHHREHAYARRVFNNDRAAQKCLLALWERESNWNPNAVEDQPINGQPPTYAYGIPQANPSVFGHPFALGDWRAQIRWGHRYINRRYHGSPCEAEGHEEAHGWY